MRTGKMMTEELQQKAKKLSDRKWPRVIFEFFKQRSLLQFQAAEILLLDKMVLLWYYKYSFQTPPVQGESVQ